MSEQNSHVVDLRRTYFPSNPNAFPVALQQEVDKDTFRSYVPIIPYDGYNFMPTPYGYSSFFGLNSPLGIENLVGNVDHIFVVQTYAFANIAVALKDDGIWTKDLSVGGAWSQVAVYTVTPGVHPLWSWCIIEQDLYIYRQGSAHFHKWGDATSFVWTAIVPNFLVMATQLGIFKAGGRLAFWDAANSIGWSSMINTADFEPSLETLAGTTIFQDINGKIVVVYSHGDGFVIYCTRSIVGVTRQSDSPMLFRGQSIFNNNGISYRQEAAVSDPDTVHFAFTHAGLAQISNSSPEFIAADISRYMQQRRSPIYLQLINGKFLFFKYIDSFFNVGRVNFSTYFPPGELLDWAGAKISAWDNASLDARKAVRHANFRREQIYLNRQLGYTSYAAASGIGVVPIWRNFFIASLSEVEIQNFRTAINNGTTDSFFTPYTPSIVGIGNPNPFPRYSYNNRVPAGSYGDFATLSSVSVRNNSVKNINNFTATLQIQQTTQEEFYSKQEWIWETEHLYFKKLKEFLDAMNPPTTYHDVFYTPALYAGVAEFEQDVTFDGFADPTHNFDPVVSLEREAERGKYYGLAIKSAWAQKGYAKTLSWKIHRHLRFVNVTEEVRWIGTYSSFGWPIHGQAVSAETYAEAVSEAFKTILFDAIKASVGGAWTWLPLDSQDIPGDAVVFPNPNREVRHQIARYSGPFLQQIHAIRLFPNGNEDMPGFGTPVWNWPNVTYWPAGEAVYLTQQTIYETFETEFIHGDIDPKIYNKLGYTQIVGHGHYTAGALIQDNATTEAIDYIDYFSLLGTLVDPYSMEAVYVNNAASTLINQDVSPVWDECGTFADKDADTFINAVEYEGLCEEAVEEVSTQPTLWQAGSPEPVYPTFEGAFVLDINLKKWGKLKLQYKNLFDSYPINSSAGAGIFPYEHFLPKMSVRLPAGTLFAFDEFPSDSELCYGKIGFNRIGFTNLEEVVYHFADFKNGTLTIEGSTDSRDTNYNFIVNRPYVGVANGREGFEISAKWYNIVFKNHYDITHLEVIFKRAGRR